MSGIAPLTNASFGNLLTAAQIAKLPYNPLGWPGFNRASSWEMTIFGVWALINFIATGSLLLTHLWCRNTLDIPRRLRRRYRAYRKRKSSGDVEEEDEDDWFALELQADRATLNLLAISCLITAPWILLYLDSDVAYGKKPPAYGVCLVQASFVMGWAVTLAAGALGVVMKMWLRITRLNSSLMPYVMPLWQEIMLLVLPWALCSIIFITSLTLGLVHPVRVRMGQFYCWIGSYELQRSVLAISSALLLVVLMLEIHMAVFIVRYLVVSDRVATRTATRPPAMSERTDMQPPMTMMTMEENRAEQNRQAAPGKKEVRRFRGIRIGTIVRPMGFGVACLTGLSMTTVTLTVDRTATWAKLVLASIPLGAFLAYASQPEILRVWGLGRLLGDSPSSRGDSGATSTVMQPATYGLDVSSQPYWGSATRNSATTEDESKTSSEDKDGLDHAVIALAYDGQNGPIDHSIEAEHKGNEIETAPAPDVPAPSGADLFRRGMREWNMLTGRSEQENVGASPIRKGSI